jgi:hypothetical protein
MSELFYCRVAVPETDGSEEQSARAFAAAKEHAIAEVKHALDLAGEDWKRGHHRVTMSMDSTFETASVIAEWWPYE